MSREGSEPTMQKAKPPKTKREKGTTPRYWLMKSEPDVYSINDLKRERRACWEGVRNYRARNYMRDEMTVGELALFYHSNASPPGVAGVARVASEPYADHTQFDPQSKYFDPKSSKEKPRWMMVDVEFVEAFASELPLATLREDPKLEGMALLARGQRLSIQTVDAKHFQHILRLANAHTTINT